MILRKLRPIIPELLFKKLNSFSNQRQLEQWNQKGRPTPPPHIVKQLLIKEFQKKYAVNVLVETGTYLGTMIEAQLNHFDKIVSIELDEKLYLAAKNKFKKFPKVEIINGDSGKVMPKVIASLKERAIFWLDGHFSSGVTAKGEKDCPIYEELNAILDSKIKNHIFLIDDARLFVGKNDYPTLNELKNYFSINAPDYHLKVENDVIICTN